MLQTVNQCPACLEQPLFCEITLGAFLSLSLFLSFSIFFPPPFNSLSLWVALPPLRCGSARDAGLFMSAATTIAHRSPETPFHHQICLMFYSCPHTDPAPLISINTRLAHSHTHTHTHTHTTSLFLVHSSKYKHSWRTQILTDALIAQTWSKHVSLTNSHTPLALQSYWQ